MHGCQLKLTRAEANVITQTHERLHQTRARPFTQQSMHVSLMIYEMAWVLWLLDAVKHTCEMNSHPNDLQQQWARKNLADRLGSSACCSHLLSDLRAGDQQDMMLLSNRDLIVTSKIGHEGPNNARNRHCTEHNSSQGG